MATWSTEYVATLDQRDPARILAAKQVDGRTTRYDKHSKQVILTLPTEAERTWGYAIRAKFIGLK